MTNQVKTPSASSGWINPYPIVFSFFTAVVFELFHSRKELGLALTSSREKIFLIVSITGLVAAFFTAIWLGMTAWLFLNRRKRTLFSERSFRFSRIPHHPLVIGTWVIGAMIYILLMYFQGEFHDHHMIALSLAVIFSMLFYAISICIFWVSQRYEFNLQAGAGSKKTMPFGDFFLNPYVLSLLLAGLVVAVNLSWIRLVLPIPLILQITTAAGVYFFSERFLKTRIVTSPSEWVGAGILLLLLSAVPVFTLNYSQNVRVMIGKMGLISSRIMKPIIKTIPVDRLPVVASKPTDESLFDFNSYYQKLAKQNNRFSAPPEEPLSFQDDSLIVISIDSLRADHLSCYGYPFKTTPHIDDLAEESTLFRWNFIQGGDSPHSIASFLSGKYPDNYQAGSTELLKDYLKRAGFTTVHVGYSSVFKGCDFTANYDHLILIEKDYHEVWATRTSGEIIRETIRLLKQIGHGRIFLYIHLFDPHAPHLENEFTRQFEGSEHPGYDGEIAATDAALGDLFDFFKTENRWDKTGIVVTADHGDEFEEHGGKWHGKNLYNESIHTPLILKLPGIRPQRIDVPVESVDIVPTVLSFFHPESDIKLDGDDLSGLILKNILPSDPVVYSMIPVEEFRKYAVIFGPWKLIYSVPDQTFEMYNFIEDPRENVNVYDQLPSVAGQMKQKLKERYLVEDQSAKSARIVYLNEPRDIAMIGVEEYAVSDLKNGRIVVFDRSDQPLYQFGKPGRGMDCFSEPSGVWFDGERIMIADLLNHRLQVTDKQGRWLWTSRYSFTYPFDVVSVDGTVWVTDIGAHRIVQLDSAGEQKLAFGSRGSGPDQFNRPAGITADDRGNVYVADTANHRIQVFDAQGKFLKLLPFDGWRDDPMCFPFLCPGPDGHLFVTDPPDHRIVIVATETGKTVRIYPEPGFGEAPFHYPMGIAWDKQSESLLVADSGSDSILRIPVARILQ